MNVINFQCFLPGHVEQGHQPNFLVFLTEAASRRKQLKSLPPFQFSADFVLGSVALGCTLLIISPLTPCDS